MVIIMQKKKGFTLVELLAVIVILAILALIAVPNVSSLVRKSKTNMFCKKVESIEAAAKYYAQDYLSDLTTTDGTIVANKIPLRLLVEKGYLKKDKEKCTIGVDCVTDPRDNSSLDNNYIDIYSENNRLYGRYLYTSLDATNKVCGEKATYNINEYGTYTESGDFTGYSRLDVNSSTESENGYSWGNLNFTFDLYVDNKKVVSQRDDYCAEDTYKKGQVYKITNIRPKAGNSCKKYGFGNSAGTFALSGVLTSDSTSIDIICLEK